MTRRDKDNSGLLSETAPGPSELTRAFADDPGHVPAEGLLDELAAEHDREEQRQAALAAYEPSVPGPPFDPMPRGTLTGYQTETADGVRAYAGSDDEQAIRAAAEWNRAETRQAKPVYEQCPDKGTCHHACILGTGACFRVLYAGPLSGRYPEDKWPGEMRIEHMKRELEGRPLPRRLKAHETDPEDGSVIFRLRSGDVIHAYVDPMDGTLIVENRVSNLAVFPVSPNRAKVM